MHTLEKSQTSICLNIRLGGKSESSLCLKICLDNSSWSNEVELNNNTIIALKDLGYVLKSIYVRMQNDGYRIKDGVMVNEK